MAAFSYNAALITSLDKVRFLLQDTTNTTARPNLLDDGEITWTISTEANVYMAAAMCAETMATRFRGLVSKTVGNLSLTYDRAAETWQAIADRLRTRGSLHMLPTAGGILSADRDAFWEDSDLLRPSFFDGLQQSDAQSPQPPINPELLP